METILSWLLLIWFVFGLFVGLFEAVEPRSPRINPKKRILYWILLGISGTLFVSIVRSITSFFIWLEK
jgi:hypothetical protein